MLSQKRLSKNSSSNRESSKIIISNCKRFSELESFVGFALDNKVSNINYMETPLLDHNENSKESFDIYYNKIMKKDLKLVQKILETDYF